MTEKSTVKKYGKHLEANINEHTDLEIDRLDIQRQCFR